VRAREEREKKDEGEGRTARKEQVVKEALKEERGGRKEGK